MAHLFQGVRRQRKFNGADFYEKPEYQIEMAHYKSVSQVMQADIYKGSAVLQERKTDAVPCVKRRTHQV